jgi:integrase
VRGHIRKRGKRWVFVVDAGRDPETGKRKQKWSRSYPTRREAEQELRKSLGRLDLGDDPVPPKVTVEQLAERWSEHMGAIGRPKEKVRRGYMSSVRTDVLPMIGGLEVRKTKPAHAQAVLDKFAEDHAPATVGRLRNVMSSMFSTALAWDLCQTNPVAATRTPARQKPKLLIPESDEVRAVVEAARDTPYAVPILLAAVTGARRSELIAMAWPSIDLGAGAVQIERTLQRVGDRLVFSDTTKSSHGTRTVPLPAFGVARLRLHRADQMRRRLALGGEWHDFDLVVERGDGRPIDPDLLSQAFKRIARSVGVDCRLHDLRHAFATRLMHSGLHAVEVAEIMGHASPSFTANVYQHASQESLERTRHAVEEAFGE